MARVRFRPGVICGLSLVPARLAPRGFSMVFLPPQEPTFQIPIRRGKTEDPHENRVRLIWLTSKYGGLDKSKIVLIERKIIGKQTGIFPKATGFLG